MPPKARVVKPRVTQPRARRKRWKKNVATNFYFSLLLHIFYACSGERLVPGCTLNRTTQKRTTPVFGPILSKVVVFQPVFGNRRVFDSFFLKPPPFSFNFGGGFGNSTPEIVKLSAQIRNFLKNRVARFRVFSGFCRKPTFPNTERKGHGNSAVVFFLKNTSFCESKFEISVEARFF